MFWYRLLICSTQRLLHPVGIQLRVEADHVILADPVGRGTQVTARPHRPLQDLLLFPGDLVETLKLLPLGDGYRLCALEDVPDLVRIVTGGPGIDNFMRFELFFPKKLLGIFAGRSALAQVGPIDVHLLLLWLV